MRLLRLLNLALLVLGLAGCASSPSTTERYTLPAGTHSPERTSESPEKTLILDSVQLASHLDDQGIVLQRDDVLLHQASSHLWAENLGSQLSRGLRQRLASHLPATRVLSGANQTTAPHLHVEVDQFQGRYDGMAVVGGRWQLRDAEGKLLVYEPFTVTTALASDGYPALVRALGRSWDKLAEQIAERIETLP